MEQKGSQTNHRPIKQKIHEKNAHFSGCGVRSDNWGTQIEKGLGLLSQTLICVSFLNFPLHPELPHKLQNQVLRLERQPTQFPTYQIENLK